MSDHRNRRRGSWIARGALAAVAVAIALLVAGGAFAAALIALAAAAGVTGLGVVAANARAARVPDAADVLTVDPTGRRDSEEGRAPER
jgi:hypothetical protein